MLDSHLVNKHRKGIIMSPVMAESFLAHAIEMNKTYIQDYSIYYINCDLFGVYLENSKANKERIELMHQEQAIYFALLCAAERGEI